MKDIDKVFKALADPSRRRLLDRLYEKNGQTLTAMCKGLDMTRQAVTQHLGILEAANMVTTVWRGREKFYYINPVEIRLGPWLPVCFQDSSTVQTLTHLDAEK